MPENYSILTVAELTEDIVNKFMCDTPAFFVGSHVSSYSPTSLPTGQGFGWALYHYIFQDFADNPLLEKLYSDIPFEALMESCPALKKVKKVLAKIYQNKRFNAAHSLLAQQLEQKVISALITPDYDMTFDEVLLKTGKRPVVEKDDLNDEANGLYFKIHGSADQPSTMICTLQEEGELEDWKYKLLTKLTKGKTIIFAGYSGRDFDICPVLAFDRNYKQIIWLHFDEPDKLSPYAKYLLNSNPANILVVGDFCKFLSKIFYQNVKAESGSGGFNAALLELTDAEIISWQLNILDRLAFASLGRPLLCRSKHMVSTKSYRTLKASFFGHQGCYLQCAKQCIALYRDSGLPLTDRIQQLVSAISTYRSYGNFAIAWWYNRKLKQLVEGSAPSEISDVLLLRLKLTFLMTRNQYCLRLGFKRLSRRLVTEAQVIYDKLYKLLIHSGSWDDRQSIQHMAERLKLNMHDRPLALTANIGFRNLGMPGMEIISVKDLIRYGDAEQRRQGIDRLNESIATAKGIGMYTETWKHNRLKILYASIDARERRECFTEWWINLNRCEYYPFTLRVLYLLDYLIIRIKTFR